MSLLDAFEIAYETIAKRAGGLKDPNEIENYDKAVQQLGWCENTRVHFYKLFQYYSDMPKRKDWKDSLLYGFETFQMTKDQFPIIKE
jgi:hypothetical protein